jgi:hypothetical protein
MRTTACKNISQYNTTTHRAKPTINPLSIAKNKASRYSFYSATALGNPWPIGAAALHDSTISVDRPVWSLSPLSAALPESPHPFAVTALAPLVVLPQYSILWLLLCSPLQDSRFSFKKLVSHFMNNINSCFLE